jgi:DnaK suppressor protein
VSKNRSLEIIKNKLLERKKELEEALKSLATEDIDDDPGQDLGDQVSSATSQVLRQSLSNSELAQYNKVLRALKSIDEGTYGICIDCDQQISEKRLNVYPYASRCISCQEAFEK